MADDLPDPLNMRSHPVLASEDRVLLVADDRLAEVQAMVLQELRKSGLRVSWQIVVNSLKAQGVEPGPTCYDGSWDEFITIDLDTLRSRQTTSPIVAKTGSTVAARSSVTFPTPWCGRSRWSNVGISRSAVNSPVRFRWTWENKPPG